MDRLQYQLQQGPCVDAVLDPDKAEVVVADMACDQRWPEYARAAADFGFRSQMGIRVFDESGSVGGLNLYSKQVDAFGEETMGLCGGVDACQGMNLVSTARRRCRKRVPMRRPAGAGPRR